MTWLELYNFLNKKANKIDNYGDFNWQQDVEIFDFATLDYYKAEFIQTPDKKISLSVDTTQLENISGT